MLPSIRAISQNIAIIASPFKKKCCPGESPTTAIGIPVDLTLLCRLVISKPHGLLEGSYKPEEEL